MADKKLTPMLRQYLAVKERYPDCLVFFRLGDFYEMFFDDAAVGARELDLALTTRDRNKPPEERTPMCGVPYHAVKNYISKLTAKGYKVVICEQMEDPATAQGLVERDVTRIVTPGTVLEPEALEEDANSYLCALWLDQDWAGLAFCDLSTGQFEALAARLPQEGSRLYSELESRRPREMVFAQTAWDALSGELGRRLGCHCERGEESGFFPQRARELVQAQFARVEGALADDEGEEAATRAVGGLLSYLYQTQRATHIPTLRTLSLRSGRTYMELDRTARRNLELTETLRGKEKKGSLLWVMDRCRTAMGHRRLRAWLERPLVDVGAIEYRQKGVAALLKDAPLRQELRRTLANVGDLERMVSRLGVGDGNARELQALAAALGPVPRIMELLGQAKAPICRDLLGQMDALDALTAELDRAVGQGDLPVSVRDGGIIAPGYDDQVDHYQALLRGGGQAVMDLEARERERTGIRNLKVKYNKVFGYYIEISNAYKGEVPEEYIRRQTITSGERYISPELKELEEEILNARERDAQLEYEIFCRLRQLAVDAAGAIQQNADAIAQLDVLCALADLAQSERYVRPKVDDSRIIDIEGGRHPVVEKTLDSGLFVPNNTFMDGENITVALITGPNMAGKSTYMRQVGLMVLMAQMGSYVPAKRARVGVVDQVFTRIGASDDLASGQSTFMVEMMEVAYILSHATSRSLLLMDEIGRGTSTYDGLSIAQSVMEYCAQTVRAKTIFSTHYHELGDAAAQTPYCMNFNIAAQKQGDKVVFLRKIVPGSASRSYGVEVAALAGVPQEVIARAGQLLQDAELEKRPVQERARQSQSPEETAAAQTADGPGEYPGWAAEVMEELRKMRQAQERGETVKYDMTKWWPKDVGFIVDTYGAALPVLHQLDQIDADRLTPMEALQLVYQLKQHTERAGWKWNWPEK